MVSTGPVRYTGTEQNDGVKYRLTYSDNGYAFEQPQETSLGEVVSKMCPRVIKTYVNLPFLIVIGAVSTLRQSAPQNATRMPTLKKMMSPLGTPTKVN